MTILKQTLALLLLAVVFAPRFVWALGAPARVDLLDRNVIIDIQDQADRSASAFGRTTTETTLAQYIANLLNVFLGLLGTIFIILIVYAGYTWMTAAGNSEKVEKAQTTLRVAIIGLVIIVAAYAITYFIFSRLPEG